MKLVIQRVSSASVTVQDQMIGQIGNGLLVLLGVSQTDTREIADKMVNKLIRLRIFEDAEGTTNCSIKDVNGDLLIISQFTLYADCRKGNRPSFINAGSPDMANELYEYVIGKCREEIPVVEHGSFGANMEVSLVNHGPFTIVLDSDEIMRTV